MPTDILRRLLRHCLAPASLAARCFPAVTMDRIEARVALAETQHSAEIRIAIESALSVRAVLAGQSPRERALELFAGLRVWDTQASNGVLLYILLADQAVEIVADRAAAQRVAPQVWHEACTVLAKACAEGRHEQGTLAAIDLLDLALVDAFPPRADDVDELPNRPTVV